jgi:hypothetical protein
MNKPDLRRLRDDLYADLAMLEGLAGVGIADGQLTIYVADADAEAKLREIVAGKALQVPVRYVVTGPTRLA